MLDQLQTIETLESTYQYRLEHARIALLQAQEHLAALLAEQPCSDDDTLPDPSPVARLAVLLADPEFQLGLQLAQETLLDFFQPAPLTENEMIREVEGELSRHVYERDRQSCRTLGWEPVPYLHRLGYLIGTVAQGLSYGEAGKPEQEGPSC